MRKNIGVVLLVSIALLVTVFGKTMIENRNKEFAAQDSLYSEKNAQAANDLVEEKKVKATVTFIDDDGTNAFVEQAKPVFDKNDVKVSVAVLIQEVGKSGMLNTEELKNIEAEGFEVVSHSYSEELHNISTVPELELELSNAKEFMQNNNFKGQDIIVYPTGFTLDKKYGDRTGKETIDHVKDYFKYGFNAWGENSSQFNEHMIGRVDFNADMDTLIQKVDEYAESGRYLVFMTHAWMPEFDGDKLDELIKYIKSKEVEILTAGDALKKMEANNSIQ